MSKSSFNKIVAKLDNLDEYLKILKDLQKVNRKSFINDYHFYALAERYLQLSIEILLDVGKLLIVVGNLRKPESNDDIFVILRENKILSENIASSMEGIAKFRNILVHHYENINRAIIYEKLQKNLQDFKLFQQQIARYLKKHF